MESEKGLCLHRKQGTTEEWWALSSLTSLLTVAIVQLYFHYFLFALKVKLLLWVLHFPCSLVYEMKAP
jgi:hypothetical protein